MPTRWWDPHLNVMFWDWGVHGEFQNIWVHLSWLRLTVANLGFKTYFARVGGG